MSASLKSLVKFGREKYETYKYEKKVNRIIKSLNIPRHREKGYSSEIDNYWKDQLGLKINKKWHHLYSSVNHNKSVLYIPESLFYTLIEPKINPRKLATAYMDKNSYSMFLGDYPEASTPLKNKGGVFFDYKNSPVTFDEAKNIFNKLRGKFFIKPSLETGGGRSVSCFSVDNKNVLMNNKSSSFESLNDLYCKDFLIQEKVQQHKDIGKFHPHSLNTIRIVTLKWNGEVTILSKIIRFGDGNSTIDNGYLACGIDDDGKLNKVAISKNGAKINNHPYSGLVFQENHIPNFVKVIELVKNMHLRVPYFKMVSWDIGIDTFGEPILIELNLAGQEINFHQFNNGPIFKNKTNAVMEHVVQECRMKL